MDERTKSKVWMRAQSRCEYCHLHQEFTVLPHQLDHIVPIKHHGNELLENLALACSACNNHKGTNLVGVDTKTKKIIRLFDPRNDRWRTHFRWDGALLVGKTAIGRVTVDVLPINLSYRVELRQELIQMKLFRS